MRRLSARHVASCAARKNFGVKGAGRARSLGFDEGPSRTPRMTASLDRLDGALLVRRAQSVTPDRGDRHDMFLHFEDDPLRASKDSGQQGPRARTLGPRNLPASRVVRQAASAAPEKAEVDRAKARVTARASLRPGRPPGGATGRDANARRSW